MTEQEQKWIETNNQVCALLRQAHDVLALSSLPPKRTWVGLTNNDLQPIADEYQILFGSWVHDFARAIEAKLKQKNGFAEEKNK